MNDAGFRAVDFEQLRISYAEQVRALLEGGVDLLLVETIFDTLNAKAAMFAIKEVFGAGARRVPVMISGTITDLSGRTLTGQTVEAFWNSVAHARAGERRVELRARAGRDAASSSKSSTASRHVLSVPTRTRVLPDPLSETGFPETPESLAPQLREWAELGWLNIVGGCCGTTPEHIRALADAVRDCAPRKTHASLAREERNGVRHATRLSGMEAFNLTSETGFVMIGERTNVTGSPKFAKLILAGDYEAALAVAKQQVENGAKILDINMDEGMLDGAAAMTRFVNLVPSEPDIAKVPLMIDSSKWDVIEAGLRCAQGKGIVNSISLKGGEDQFLEQARLVRRYGAAVVVMAFDEEGQADTFERKIADLRTQLTICSSRKSAIPPEDIIFDPNILTVGTGIEEHNVYAVNFIEATRWIKEHLPHARVSGGISNISFSFRGNNVVREAMHSAFLLHAIRAGLDMGIVNAGMLEVYDEIAPELRELVEDVLLNRRPDATERLVTFRGRLATEGQNQGAGGGCAMAPRLDRGPARARFGQRDRRPHRCRYRGSAAEIRKTAARDRRPVDGRYEHRRRPVRRGKNVSPTGREDRARDEKSGRVFVAVHGSGKSRDPCRGRRSARARQGVDGHGERGRARHRQEHRRRGPRL